MKTKHEAQRFMMFEDGNDLTGRILETDKGPFLTVKYGFRIELSLQEWQRFKSVVDEAFERWNDATLTLDVKPPGEES